MEGYKLKKNDIIPLCINDVAHSGEGVGRYDGMAVFVPMAAPLDEIEAKVVKVLKNRAYAIIQRIVKASPQRVENDCPVYRRCGGCSLRHIDYGYELAIKAGWVEDNLRRIGGVTPVFEEPLPSPSSLRYRNKAQYPVRLLGGKIQAGFFARRSHDLIPVEDCQLQPAFFARAVQEIVAFCEEYSILPYDEEAHSGVLRHIFLRYAQASDEAMLCLVVNGQKMPHADTLLQRLASGCPQIVTVVLNENRARTNVIFGDKTTVLAGTGFITDVLGGVRVRLSAQSFYQVNRPAAEALYATALKYASPTENDILLDLYCGAGTIGLSMAHAVKKVIGVEVVPQAVEDARETAIRNGISNAEFICADAGAAAEKLLLQEIKPDIIVLDPPRKGADDAVLQCIAALSPRKVVYISCDSATLARDLKALSADGFRVVRARAVDMFPRTAHVECVVLLENY